MRRPWDTCLSEKFRKQDIIYPKYVTNKSVFVVVELEEALDTSSSLTWVVGTFCVCWGAGRSVDKKGNVGTVFKRVKSFELAGI